MSSFQVISLNALTLVFKIKRSFILKRTLLIMIQHHEENMSSQDHIHLQFGIDEIYIHDRLTNDLLEKLKIRSNLTLDGKDSIVLRHASHDMILIFYKRIPSQNLIYRFLEKLQKLPNKENFIKSNSLINEEELFSAIKAKNYILVTHRILP
jgi:hypothetical protein